MGVDVFKVIIQKQKKDEQRPSISQLKIGHILYKTMNVGNEIIDTKKIGRNRIIVICRNGETANKLVESKELKLEHEAFIPFSFISRAAVIRDVDVEYTDDELKNEIETGPYKILSVKRMRRRMFNEGVVTFGNSRSVKVFFEGSQFPSAVYLWGVRLKCEPFTPPIIQCFRCLRYNHTTNQCRGQRVCKRCGSKQEQEHDCQDEMCINCKGAHPADSQECPEKKRQKTVKEIMVFQNLSFMEAMSMVPKANNNDMYSVITNNRFDIFRDNYDEAFPMAGSGGQSANVGPSTRVFEPYRPTAQARRKIGQTRTQKEQPKRRRNVNSPQSLRQDKKKCTEEAQKGNEEKQNNRQNKLVGYEGLRQDRNYSKYEGNSSNFQTQKHQEINTIQNKENKKYYDSRETLIDMNSSNESAMSHEDITVDTNNTTIINLTATGTGTGTGAGTGTNQESK
ncbi:hypothetical protein WDU94_003668 [Cyamophila willieti]